MAGNIAQGNVIREFAIGNTRVKICDDCCRDRTPAEVDAILQRIARQAMVGFSTPPAATRHEPINTTI